MIPALLTANQQFDGGQGTTNDPQPGYLFVIQALQRVENDRRTVAAYEQLLKLYKEYVIGGASSGISQIQVDQVASNLASQKGSLLADEASYKAAMDNYRTSLGLPPDLPMILDRSPLSSFRNVFNNLDKWAAQEEHDPEDLNGIIGQLPRLESIVIDDRQLFEYNGTLLTQDWAEGEKQQEFLLAGERVALENRLDLMNQRAQLYDAWRNLAVQANGLKGVFNVNISNTITTAPGNSNPLGFIDQAKQFSVSFNTELPLVRVAERNQYRLATITYNRQQRVLQNAEDAIKLAIRQEIYQLIAVSNNYEINRGNLLIVVRQRDLSLQNIIAPPTSIDASNAAQQATQTNNLITGINSILSIQQSLIQNWVQFQVLRLSLYRDLGLMPYDEWEAFYEFFPSGSGPGLIPRPETTELPPLDRPRSRRRAGGRKALATFGVLAVVVAGLGAFYWGPVQKLFAGFFKNPASQVIRYKVTRGKLAVTITERGNLESAKNTDIKNEVEGQTTIISIKPEGSQVKKGDLVAELDSATLRDNLVNQEITTKRAQADLDNAIKTRTVAEISVNEYLEGTYPQEQQTIKGEIKLAESELARATDRLDWSESMLKTQYVSASQVLADSMSKSKSEISLANANKKWYVLENFTKQKQITELKANVNKAESDELAKKSTFELEKTKEEKLRRQIDKCKLFAPRRRPDRLRQRQQQVRQQRAADRGGGHRPRAADHLQPPRHHQHAGQHQGPRVDDRPRRPRPAGPDQGGRAAEPQP